MRGIQREFDFRKDYAIIEQYDEQFAFVKECVKDTETNIPFTCSREALEARLTFLNKEFDALDKLHKRLERNSLNTKTYDDLSCRYEKLIERLQTLKQQEIPNVNQLIV